MERHLRVIGAGLDRQVATAALRYQLVAVEAGQIDQRLRPPPGKAVAIAEQAGAQPEGQGETGRAKARHLAAVTWSVLAAGQARGGIGPDTQHPHDFAGLLRGQVECREIRLCLLRRGDAGLMFALERVARCRMGEAPHAGSSEQAGGRGQERATAAQCASTSMFTSSST